MNDNNGKIASHGDGRKPPHRSDSKKIVFTKRTAAKPAENKPAHLKSAIVRTGVNKSAPAKPSAAKPTASGGNRRGEIRQNSGWRHDDKRRTDVFKHEIRHDAVRHDEVRHVEVSQDAVQHDAVRPVEIPHDEIRQEEVRPAREVLHTLRDGAEPKLLSLLGFAARARKLMAGTDICRDAVRRGETMVIIVAADASQNTKKRIIDACKYYECDVCVSKVKSAELSKRIGKTGDIAVIGVTDMNFTNGIVALFDERSHIDI